MSDLELSRISAKLSIILICAAIAALFVVIGVAGIAPKINSVLQKVENIEDRFQEFADEVQPVVAAGAGKAIETIKKVDAQQLSETTTEKTDEIIEEAGSKIKNWINKK